MNCKECGKAYEVGVKDCCSNECFRKNVQKRIDEATKNDESHIKKNLMGILVKNYSILDIS